AIFESTLNPATRRAGGMHYTSIENIHKVIDPLFLDGYRAAYAAAMQEKQPKRRHEKLRDLQEALGRGKYFDKMTTELIRAAGREGLGIKGFSVERRESREVAA
ncbi:type IIL restriction-modification enzyme MmeI, partial [Selenomonas sp.]